ncbi:MAG: efflux RND transporter periplasmic adaptor subunit [Anaerolineae bacterium]|nr:MAG: efflux RND transporter periplasmic adaptor subunit [Anaerolineae bacterium]
MFSRLKKLWKRGEDVESGSNSNPKRRRWLAPAILAGMLGLALIVWGLLSNRPAGVADSEAIQFYRVESGVLEQTIDATGNIRAAQAVSLTWPTSGIVDSVLVQEGQVVERGQSLATLAQDSLPASLLLAQADYLEAKTALEDFYNSFSGLALVEAQKAVSDARVAYEDAHYAYESLFGVPNDLSVEDAHAQVILIQDQLDRAQREYDKYANKPLDNPNRIHAVQALADVQDRYDDAVRTYNALIGNASDITVAAAQSEMLVAEQVLKDAQAEYERLLAGPTAEETAAAEAQLLAAESTLKQAIVEAPFGGRIALALPESGDYVQTGDVAFEIIDDTHYYVDVSVNELDIHEVEVGQAATIVLDAFQERTYEAEVVKVGAIGQDSSGIISYSVVVELLAPDETVRPGMTSTVSITVSESVETLLVPNEAVRLEGEEYVVYVLELGSGLNPILVEIGASSSEFTQILGGELQAGDMIALNPDQVINQEQAGPGIGFLRLFGAGPQTQFSGPGGPQGPGGGTGGTFQDEPDNDFVPVPPEGAP